MTLKVSRRNAGSKDARVFDEWARVHPVEAKRIRAKTRALRTARLGEKNRKKYAREYGREHGGAAPQAKPFLKCDACGAAFRDVHRDGLACAVCPFGTIQKVF